ncbi:MAG: 30S ribosomal protein S12 methylthiotransferase RimO [Spirochaetaceae bacterium]|jgi:ribosomal protein S12 methylthiotransferase|nr:30S ribosomal protein S12 methylthiotransferase RimO [Spirochaetaceae bacterium]
MFLYRIVMLYYLDPFGCVKNQVDAETMMAFLERAGWRSADRPEEADCILINSCGFIQSAKQESINAVLSYRKQFPAKKIVLAGCLAQRYAAELTASLPEADLLFTSPDLSALPTALQSLTAAQPDNQPPPCTSLPAGERPLLSVPGSAYVKISEGCNNRCSFCAIPLIRGPLRSRSVEAITDECQVLLERGIRELCIIGQDIGSYGMDWGETALPRLLRTISGFKGDFWIRLLYLHPDNFPLSLLDTVRNDSRFLPYFDIPFQHGSDTVLRAMNRQRTVASYYALLDHIRSALPDAVIRSTFLIGFPGETAADFQLLLRFQEQAALDWVGSFIYSREEGTAAYSFKPQVSQRIAAARKALLEERQISLTERRMDRFVGRSVTALVEACIDAAAGLYLGRLFCQAPEVDGAAVIKSTKALSLGNFVQGTVKSRAAFDLEVLVR